MCQIVRLAGGVTPLTSDNLTHLTPLPGEDRTPDLMDDTATARPHGRRTDNLTPEERARLAATFGAHLKRLRAERGYSQAETARLAGLSPDTVSSLEQGRRRPGKQTIRALAEALAPAPLALFIDGTAQALEDAAAFSLRPGWQHARRRGRSERIRQEVRDARRARDAAVRAYRAAERVAQHHPEDPQHRERAEHLRQQVHDLAAQVEALTQT